MENCDCKPKHLILCLILVLGAIGWLGFNYLFPPTLITAVGEGKVSVQPTQVKFTVGLTNAAGDAQLAMDNNQKLSKNLREVAKARGVKEEEILVSYPRVISPALGLSKDWQATNTLDITLRNLKNFDILVAQIYALGATSVSNIVFTTDNSQALEKEAVSKAIKDSQQRGQEIAKSLGKRVVKVVSVATTEAGEAGALSGQAQTTASFVSGASSPSQIEIARQASLVLEIR